MPGLEKYGRSRSRQTHPYLVCRPFDDSDAALESDTSNERRR